MNTEDLATFIEAHYFAGEQTLRRWLDEAAGDKATAELALWLRSTKKLVPSKRGAELAEVVLSAGGCKVVHWHHPHYPLRLASTLRDQAPPLLYCRGDLAHFGVPQFAIIGMRRPSAFGRSAARSYARLAAEAGWSIVSGNAPGIDAEAHENALKAGGITVVFPPTPLDKFQPNFCVPGEAAQRVLIASRYVPGSDVTPWNFLGRNQLVAALCRAALVAETGMRGGTLDTVGHLRRFQRPWFVTAMPAEAPHSKAHALLSASGGRPVPLEPSAEFVHNLLSGLPVSDDAELDTTADLFGGTYER